MKNERLPLVSLGIPTYNRSQSLKKTIQSVQQQTYPNMEIIIADNASSDETMGMVEEMMLKDTRIKYIRYEYPQSLFQRFKSIKTLAKGEYFMWISDRDTLGEDIVPDYVAFLEQHLDCATVSSRVQYWKNSSPLHTAAGIQLEDTNRFARVWRYYSSAIIGEMRYGMFRRKLIDNISLFKSFAGDWHFIAAVAFRGKIKCLNRIGHHQEYEDIDSSGLNSRSTKMPGISIFQSVFFYLSISIESFLAIVKKQEVYKEIPWAHRLCLGLTTSIVLISKYYIWIIPRMIAGKFLRLLHFPELKRQRNKLVNE